MRTALILALLIRTLLAQPGLADEPLQMKVPYSDLNLERVSGARTLYVRIKTAAEKVCRPLEAPGKDLARARIHRQCLAEAINAAVVQVDHPVLTRYASERANGSNASVKVARQ